MKKVIALILALILCLSLCACGGVNTPEKSEYDGIDKNDASNYIGVWKSQHMSFTINKGGIGRFEVDATGYGYYDFTYEVNEEVIVITIEGSIMKYKSSFELNDDGTVLSIIQNGLPVTIDNETEYRKQGL